MDDTRVQLTSAHSSGGRVYDSISLHSTVKLRANDTVTLNTDNDDGGLLLDTITHRSHFAGWLLEEDLSF